MLSGLNSLSLKRVKGKTLLTRDDKNIQVYICKRQRIHNLIESSGTSELMPRMTAYCICGGNIDKICIYGMYFHQYDTFSGLV